MNPAHELRMKMNQEDGNASFYSNCSCGWISTPNVFPAFAAMEHHQHLEELNHKGTAIGPVDARWAKIMHFSQLKQIGNGFVEPLAS